MRVRSHGRRLPDSGCGGRTDHNFSGEAPLNGTKHLGGRERDNTDANVSSASLRNDEQVRARLGRNARAHREGRDRAANVLSRGPTSDTWRGAGKKTPRWPCPPKARPWRGHPQGSIQRRAAQAVARGPNHDRGADTRRPRTSIHWGLRGRTCAARLNARQKPGRQARTRTRTCAGPPQRAAKPAACAEGHRVICVFLRALCGLWRLVRFSHASPA